MKKFINLNVSMKNFNKNNIRMAVIAKKNKTDLKKMYRSEYIFGETAVKRKYGF